MGALDELLKVPYEKATSLQKALLVLFEDEVGYEALAGEAAAELAALTERVGRLEFRLAYIKAEISDNVAIRFALEAEDWEIDEKMAEEAQ